MEEKVTKINTINSKSIGRTASVKCIVDGITQTGGPTLFSISDGTGTFVAKAFDGAGVRAYPSIKMGDVIRVLMEVREYNDALEGEVMKMFKIQGSDEKSIRDEINSELRRRAEPEKVEFMVKSQILDKLKEKFIDAARQIRLAIVQNRPIIVRHHNDADGYSSGYTLERAILPLIKKQHGTEKAMRTYYSRAPSNSPFYEIEDSIKDTAISLMDFVKFSEKIPLIVIVDTGSSRESLLGIKQGKVHGIDFIVVDHHFFEEDLISKEVLVHINPFLVGE
ncbi:MAG: DHH family phosphoesterase, partial [archaeon]